MISHAVSEKTWNMTQLQMREPQKKPHLNRKINFAVCGFWERFSIAVLGC
jgi:hypothetical protein